MTHSKAALATCLVLLLSLGVGCRKKTAKPAKPTGGVAKPAITPPKPKPATKPSTKAVTQPATRPMTPPKAEPRPEPTVGNPTGWKTTERLVLSAAEAQKAFSPDNIHVSPDGKRVAYTLKGADGTMLDGKLHNDSFLSPLFSPDSKHFACIVWIDKKCHLVLDAVKGKGYSSIRWGSLVFSSNSKRLGYVASVGGPSGVGDVVVVDGKESKRYVEIGGVLGGSFRAPIVFSEDGEHYGFNALAFKGDARNDLVVVDGKEHQVGFPKILPKFSDDGTRWGCVVYRKGKSHVVVDGQLQKGYGSLGDGSQRDFVFSPDGKHLAYCALDDDKWKVIVDERPKFTDGVRRYASPIFSPNSRRLAFVGGKMDKEGRPVLSEDRVVLDGKRQGRHGRVRSSSLTFSPDSRRLAYVLEDLETAAAVVVDDQKHQGFRRIYQNPVFTADSRNVLYVAEDKDGNMFVVIDGKPRKKYDSIMVRSRGIWLIRLHPTGPQSFSYIAVKDGAYYWVEERRVND